MAKTSPTQDATLYAIYCDGVVVHASNDYDAIFALRDTITECTEPHPIHAGRFVLGAPARVV